MPILGQEVVSMRLFMQRYQTLSLPLLATLLLNACSTVSGPDPNQLTEADRQRTRPVVAAQMQSAETKLLKRKVVITRFTDETRYGNAFLVDRNDNRVGKQAMDILSARLTGTDKFLMFERDDLGRVLSEKELAGVSQEQPGADFLIVGSISEFGRSAESEVGIFSRKKIQTARAKIKVRLLNVKTGQIIYAEEGTGEASAEANSVFGVGQRASYDASLDDKAISAAISQLISNLVSSLLDQPWRAYIVGRQGDFYVVTGSKSQGLTVGDVFDVMRKGKTLRNPQTGLLLELPGKKVAEMNISAFGSQNDNEIALAELSSGNRLENTASFDSYYVLSQKEER